LIYLLRGGLIATAEICGRPTRLGWPLLVAVGGRHVVGLF